MKNPYPATVQDVRPVTKPGSAKETIHIDYCLGDSGLTYVTGDALGVFPCNDPALVDELIATLGLDATEEVPQPSVMLSPRNAIFLPFKSIFSAPY
jgi:sulfite reductase (NADPH) flavoprotein alpha-component